MKPETPCAFCSPQVEPWVLWEGTRYRIIADAFPRLPGHILLITRRHVLHHADAPAAWWSELEAALERMRAFLLAAGGAASFWENGYADKEVPHAHVHGTPVQVRIAPEWVAAGKLLPVHGWGALRRYRDRVGGYALLIGGGGRYVALDRPFMLHALRHAVLRQTGHALDPATGGLPRGGADQVAETRRLWARWDATLSRVPPSASRTALPTASRDLPASSGPEAGICKD